MALTGLQRAGARLQILPRGLAWLPVAAWMGLIWGLSSLPSKGEPSPFLWTVLSNLAHAPLFGLLVLWAALALPRDRGWPRLTPHAVRGLLAFALIYGVFDELHQGRIPGRVPSIPDLVTDFTGAACTLWIAVYVGSGTADEQGVRRRLAVGCAGCIAAAIVASL